MGLSPSSISFIILTVLVLVLMALTIIPVPPAPTPRPAIPAGKWVVVGAGLSAASFVYYVPPPIRAAMACREASQRFGGRVLTAPQVVSPVNTKTQANEFGAWVIDPVRHRRALSWLQQLQVQVVGQDFYTHPERSFVWKNGARHPWPAPPTPSSAPYGTLGPADADAWFAYANITQADAPKVSTTALASAVLPPTSVVPAGMGWTDVCLRGFGSCPVEYGRLLSGVRASPSAVTLSYASGEAETVQGAVLTLPVAAMGKVEGLPKAARALIAASFTTVPLGVLYCTWTGQEAWWESRGFVHACASTDTPLGRVTTVSGTVLRMQVSGAEAVAAWTTTLVRDGLEAGKAQVAAHLSTVFGGAAVPLPSAVSFRGWTGGCTFWNAGVDTRAARATLARPWGADVSIWWSSGDLTDSQGTVDGCVDAGLWSAQSVATSVQGLTPPPP